VISETTFSKKFTAFWNDLLPNANNHIRLINGGLIVAEYEPYVESKRKENNALVNVIAFGLLRDISLKKITPADIWAAKFTKSARFEKILQESLRYLDRFSYGKKCNLPLEQDELVLALNLYRQMHARYLKPRGKLIVSPRFPGCGILNEAQGDILKNDTLIEVKSGERKFSVTDLRQLLTYCTMNHFSTKPYPIKHIELFNPRMGISFSDTLENLCKQLSALPSLEVFSEIQKFVTDNNFIEDYGI